MNKDKIWDNFLNIINQKISSVSFNTWFKDTKLIDMENKKILIEVPMNFHKQFIGENFTDLIDETLIELTGNSYDLEFISEDELNEQQNKNLTHNINNVNNLEEKENILLNSNLIERYTFDNFVVGDSNRFAFIAAQNVSKSPGELYNPLFIHGKSGLGKTHLMNAIGNYIKENTNKTVIYITSDQFINEYIDITIKNKNNDYDYVNHFKNKFRNIDVLIIDDIQFLGGAEKTQQEFFHTFNSLYDSNKQIIISSDKSPDDLKFLEERLRTRFCGGLLANIYPPDFELKWRIIQNKINCYDSINSIVENDVIDYIANNCENDVRHIEGTIKRLLAYSAMMTPKIINLEFAVEALKDYIGNNSYIKSNISKIQKVVADYYDITIEALKSKKRSANINYPRQIAIYLCRMLTDETITRIGLEFGGRNHSTVIHSYEKISADLKENNQLKIMIDDIKAKIN